MIYTKCLNIRNIKNQEVQTPKPKVFSKTVFEFLISDI